MKLYLKTLFLALVMVQNVNAQSKYIPLAIDSAHWIISSNYLDFYTGDRSTHISAYTILGDSVYNGITYKKLYCGVYATDSTVCGLIRDDTVRERVYFIGERTRPCYYYASEESLLYDFGAEVGDTIYTCGTYEYPYIVERIDTIYEYGQKRRIFWGPHNYAIIEGIGIESGLFGYPHDIEFISYYSGYCFGADEKCALILSTESQLEHIEIKISPNPVKDQLYLSAPYTGTLKIYDQLGVVQHIYPLNNSSYIQLAPLRPGIYIVSFDDRLMRKIVIE